VCDEEIWYFPQGMVGQRRLPEFECAYWLCDPDSASDNISLEFFPSNAAEALLRLKTGNQRFMQEKSLHTHETVSWRSLLVEGQKPFATVLGCSDSRVPPEMVFDVGFGDIFTIRLAGNIIAEDVIR
jgi:carbonic anhydrase